MTRRGWIRLMICGLAAVTWEKFPLSGPVESRPKPLWFSTHEAQTLEALVETIFPLRETSPGAQGKIVLRFVHDRFRHDPGWVQWYRWGLRQLDHFSRQQARRSFIHPTPSNRSKILAAFWLEAGDSQTASFLQTVKSDAILEVCTTKAGLKWLGYSKLA